jgi:hypothetical protein
MRRSISSTKIDWTHSGIQQARSTASKLMMLDTPTCSHITTLMSGVWYWHGVMARML